MINFLKKFSVIVSLLCLCCGDRNSPTNATGRSNNHSIPLIMYSFLNPTKEKMEIRIIENNIETVLFSDDTSNLYFPNLLPNLNHIIYTKVGQGLYITKDKGSTESLIFPSTIMDFLIGIFLSPNKILLYENSALKVIDTEGKIFSELKMSLGNEYLPWYALDSNKAVLFNRNDGSIIIFDASLNTVTVNDLPNTSIGGHVYSPQKIIFVYEEEKYRAYDVEKNQFIDSSLFGIPDSIQLIYVDDSLLVWYKENKFYKESVNKTDSVDFNENPVASFYYKNRIYFEYSMGNDVYNIGMCDFADGTVTNLTSHKKEDSIIFDLEFDIKY